MIIVKKVLLLFFPAFWGLQQFQAANKNYVDEIKQLNIGFDDDLPSMQTNDILKTVIRKK